MRGNKTGNKTRRKTWISLLAAAGSAVAVVFVLQLSAFSPPAFWPPSFGERSASTVVRVGVLPDENEEELRRRYAPLLDHLSRETGLKFQLVVPDSYAHLLRMFTDHEVELGYFGGFTFVMAQTFHDVQPLVMRDVDTRFTSYFVVRNDGAFRGCGNFDCLDPTGKVFSFGPKLSTSGHLMPRHFLKTEKGIVPETAFGKVRHARGHDDTVYQVRDGAADLGVVNAEIFRAMLEDGRLKPGELRILWETPPYPDYVWAVHGDMDEGRQTKLRDAFLMLETRNADQAKILFLMGANSFLPAGVMDFMPLKKIAASLGMLTQEQP